MYRKQENNQIQFGKIIKAGASGKRLLSVREGDVKNVSVVAGREIDVFSTRCSNLELFR